MAPSSRWNLAIVASSRFFFQLKLGEQLYASSLPGNFLWIASAKGFRSVAHGAELALELGNRGVVKVLLPVEARRAVVREQLAGKLLVDRFREGLQICSPWRRARAGTWQSWRRQGSSSS